MRRVVASIALVAAVTVMIAARAAATDLRTLLNNQRPPETFKLIDVRQLAGLMKDKSSHVRIYDANGNELRKTAGMIVGARPLSSSDHYNVADELPTAHNAKLVFYCADKQCLASHEAARRAVDAGYTDVSVMMDGIQGWRDAGEPVEYPNGHANN